MAKIKDLVAGRVVCSSKLTRFVKYVDTVNSNTEELQKCLDQMKSDYKQLQ